MPQIRLALGAAFAAAVALACRDVTAPTQDPRTVTYAPALNVNLANFALDTSGVYIQDVVVGSGNTAVPQSTVSLYYTGNLADGRQFDSNVNGSSPRAFVLGTGALIQGFDRGLLGVRAGGRRRIIIPPALGYGNSSRGTAIPAGSVLVFTVDVPGVTLPDTTTTTASGERSPR